MRKLICEATWTAIKKCPAFKQFFERVMGGKSERRKIAAGGDDAPDDQGDGRDAAQRRGVPARSPPEDTGRVSWSAVFC
jgi:hypothetical protein